MTLVLMMVIVVMMVVVVMLPLERVVRAVFEVRVGDRLRMVVHRTRTGRGASRRRRRSVDVSGRRQRGPERFW